MILIHATHEAGIKVGGIGAVLDGLLGAPSYLQNVSRTICVGTLNTNNATEMERLLSPRNKLHLYYYPTGGYLNCPLALQDKLSAIEREFSVRILYGKRPFGEAEHEVLLVDPSDINPQRFGQFQYYVWEKFGLNSGRYQSNSEFTTFMAHAEPAFLALREVLTSPISSDQQLIPNHPPPVILCHEFMGLPLWYAAELNEPKKFRGAFVAHEVASVRPIVEYDGGHDTRFYNSMRLAQEEDLFLEDVFGSQDANFKHAMVKTAAQCDHVFAVGDLVVDELRFLSPRFFHKKIDLVYNGAPSKSIPLDATQASARKLKQYAKSLIGIEPTFVFSHVTRMVISKALWRDIRVMEHLDGMLAKRGETAALFMLTSVQPQGRSAEEVRRMEQSYGWPREHRYGWPDLVDLEANLYGAIAYFNLHARASQIVLINQFGFSRDRCGERMSADMSFDDLRRGTDLEFGQSIYEPFGIAQVEPLSTGALCVISDVCGCLGFVSAHSQMKQWHLRLSNLKSLLPNIIVAHYTDAPAEFNVHHWRDAMRIGQWERDQIERHVSLGVANEIIERLPRTAKQKQMLIESGFAQAKQMSWDVVAREQLLPALAYSS
jgi:hypothetical protein